MSGKVRHLLERQGRYHARIVVPAKLRPFVGKRELLAPLGGDRRLALQRLHSAVASLQDQIEAARRKLAGYGQPQRRMALADYARIHYSEEMDLDERGRDAGHPPWPGPLFLPAYIEKLRLVASGRAEVDEAGAVIGWAIGKFADRGRPTPAPGTGEWRWLARTLAAIQLETVERAQERDHGNFAGNAKHPLLAEPDSPANLPALSIRDLYDRYVKALQAAGRARSSEHRWKPVIDSLVNFLGHNDAHRVTRRDAARWKDKLLETLAPKTVRDVYVSTARAAYNHAVSNELVDSNPFAGVKVIMPARAMAREKGFTDDEAEAILKAAWVYKGSPREHDATTRAKRWLPLLAAYTGARIGEVAQLRAEDVRQQNGFHYVRLTPEAGTIKTKQYRDVPLHPHLIELGFLDMTHKVKEGPLFYMAGKRKGRTLPAQVIAGHLANWIRGLGVADKSVQPNHGWRHRFKTVGREAGIDSRVLDVIQGHAPKTAGDNYGDVTLKAKDEAIRKLPVYALM